MTVPSLGSVNVRANPPAGSGVCALCNASLRTGRARGHGAKVPGRPTRSCPESDRPGRILADPLSESASRHHECRADQSHFGHTSVPYRPDIPPISPRPEQALCRSWGASRHHDARNPRAGAEDRHVRPVEGHLVSSGTGGWGPGEATGWRSRCRRSAGRRSRWRRGGAPITPRILTFLRIPKHGNRLRGGGCRTFRTPRRCLRPRISGRSRERREGQAHHDRCHRTAECCDGQSCPTPASHRPTRSVVVGRSLAHLLSHGRARRPGRVRLLVRLRAEKKPPQARVDEHKFRTDRFVQGRTRPPIQCRWCVRGLGTDRSRTGLNLLGGLPPSLHSDSESCSLIRIPPGPSSGAPPIGCPRTISRRTDECASGVLGESH
jgi:hypothetical protein